MAAGVPVFSTKFRRQKTPEGRIQYWFDTCYSSHDEMHPLAVEGDTILSEIVEEQFRLPEEINNPVISRRVFETWITDCSGAFVRSPTIEQCLANVTAIWDSNAPIAKVDTSEQEDTWIYMWTPTKIKVDMPHFQIYWAPSYKSKLARIPDVADEGQGSSVYDGIEVDSPERSYAIAADGTRLITTTAPKASVEEQGWQLQELNLSALPLSDSPTLRLTTDYAQREKFRKRVRESRIRAKLAKYRAERLAERYEERFGEYPEEDEEEAQTEVEGSEED
jgi:hypothetical protein